MKRRIELTAPLGFLILHELRKPSTGTEIAKRIGARRGGQLLTPGTIYPALKELHKKGLITFRTDGREKIWRLRSEGDAELERLYAEFSVMFRGLKSKITGRNKSK